MSSNSKIDKYASKRQLLIAYESIKQDLTLAEVKDSQTKIMHGIGPFLKMAHAYVPKETEMSK